MSGWRRGAEANTIATQSGRWKTRAHPHKHTYVHTLELGSMRTRMSRRAHADALHAQTLFEGRFNHGDTNLRVAAWRWRWPSLSARRDEQSEHWHASRRHVNSNQRRLSVSVLCLQRPDAATALSLQSCHLSQINGKRWPVFFYTTYPFLTGIHAATMQWQVTKTGWRYDLMRRSLTWIRLEAE